MSNLDIEKLKETNQELTALLKRSLAAFDRMEESRDKWQGMAHAYRSLYHSSTNRGYLRPSKTEYNAWITGWIIFGGAMIAVNIALLCLR